MISFDVEIDIGGGWMLRGITSAVDEAGAIIKAQALVIEQFPSMREVFVTLPTKNFRATCTKLAPGNSQLVRMPQFHRTRINPT